jgi:hypothetical protein
MTSSSSPAFSFPVSSASFLPSDLSVFDHEHDFLTAGASSGSLSASSTNQPSMSLSSLSFVRPSLASSTNTSNNNTLAVASAGLQLDGANFLL